MKPNDWDALRAVPTERLVAETAPGRHRGDPRGIAAFRTTAGNRMIPADPIGAIACGAAAGVNVVVGATRHEWTGMRLGLPPGVVPRPDYATTAREARTHTDLEQRYRAQTDHEQAADVASETD